MNERHTYVHPDEIATREVGDGRQYRQLETGTYVTGGEPSQPVAQWTRGIYRPAEADEWHHRVMDSIEHGRKQAARTFKILFLLACVLGGLVLAAVVQIR